MGKDQEQNALGGHCRSREALTSLTPWGSPNSGACSSRKGLAGPLASPVLEGVGGLGMTPVPSPRKTGFCAHSLPTLVVCSNTFAQ